MRLIVAAVGRKGPFDDAIGDYVGRATKSFRSLGIDGPHIKIVEAPKAMSGSVRQAREAELLLDAIGSDARIVMMDEGGTNLKSRAFARLVADERERGAGTLAFVIGGADGFGEGFCAAATGRLAGTVAFGQATWPHMLARLMLAEQIYRAATILTNHPYHRD